MTAGQAAILGIVEGVTEYLPVSSTGHLLLAERIMGIGSNSTSTPAADRRRTQDATDAYTICIQAGAIIAVLGLYFRRVRQMLAGLLGRDRTGRRLFINVVIGFLPAAVIGLLFNKAIKTWLFGPWPVVAAWFVGGLLILMVHWWKQSRPAAARAGSTLEELTWKMALIIGIAQCIAMWPGVSRSLITIVGGVLVGMSLPAAVEYSFLLGVLTLGAATAYDALRHGQAMLQTFDPLALTVGLIFAFCLGSPGDQMDGRLPEPARSGHLRLLPGGPGRGRGRAAAGRGDLAADSADKKLPLSAPANAAVPVSQLTSQAG